jgi:DNA-binding beta-propeller fold protein YncE
MRRSWLALLALGCAGQDVDEPIADFGCGLGALDVSLALPEVVFVDEPVVVDATVSGSTPACTTVVLDFDDGTVVEELVAEHTFEEPGRYTVSLRATDGATSTATARVAVVHRPLDEAPTASSTVAFRDGRVYVAAVDLGAVVVLDGATLDEIAHLSVCSAPAKLAVDGTLLVVACSEGDPELVYIRDETWERVATVPLDVMPTGVVALPHGVYAALKPREQRGGQLLQLDRFGLLRRTEVVGQDLRGLAWSRDVGVLSRFRSPDESGELWVGPSWDLLTLAPNEGPDSDTSSRGVPNLLEAVAISPDGRSIAVGGLRSNMDRGLVRDGLALTHDTSVRATLRLVDFDGNELGRGRLDNRDLVSSVAWSPQGDWLYVAYTGMRAVEVLDPFTMALSGSQLAVGHGLDGIALSDDGRFLYAHARYDRELVQIPVNGAILGDPTRVSLLGEEGEPWSDARLRGARVFHDASNRQMSRDGYASCASCHPHGEDDGRTWDFTGREEGLRNTTTLRGMADHADGPIHRSGNFDEIQDFEADIRGPQQGSGFLDDAQWASDVGPSLGAPKAGLSTDLDDLAAYVNALPHLDVPADEVSTGRAVFVAAGCDTCHPDGGTDSSWLDDTTPLLHDVGTLTPDSGERLGGELAGLDTPTLRGVWATPPYLHDGSAPTLMDVVTTANPNDEHGVTSDLTPAQLDVLVAYLRSL